MNVNDNSLDLAQYKGMVKPCPLCSRRSPDAAMDALTSGKSCRLCLGHQFVATCTNCDGTGQFKGRTVWDGGRSEHTSVCTPCGGTGVFATRKPDNYVEPVPEVVEPQAAVVT